MRWGEVRQYNMRDELERDGIDEMREDGTRCEYEMRREEMKWDEITGLR